MPGSNSPLTNVGSKDFVCNTGARAVAGKCPVKAGGTVTVEMHQVSRHANPFTPPFPKPHPLKTPSSNPTTATARTKPSAAPIGVPCKCT